MKTLAPVALALLLGAAASSCSSSGSGGSGGAAGSAGTSSGGSGGNNADGCQKAGGVCQCAGSCPQGFFAASGALEFACPQGPPNSGMCEQGCCLPRDGGVSLEGGL